MITEQFSIGFCKVSSDVCIRYQCSSNTNRLYNATNKNVNNVHSKIEFSERDSDNGMERLELRMYYITFNQERVMYNT